VKAPPFIRGTLRPPSRHILPVFLPAEWRDVEERPHRADLLDTAAVDEVETIDARAVANEDV
jgi:hypothetical protein